VAGIPTDARPTEFHKSDAEKGANILEKLGASDLGQACVVTRGQVLAIEAMPGTAWMLRSLSAPKSAAFPKGGILFKAPKPAQDRRIDLPTIGPETMSLAAKAGLDGVVIEAGGVMVIDLSQAVEIANATGLFLWVR
jgi:DUF1009 family protein